MSNDSPDMLWFWGSSLVLAAALFFPVRKLIWVLRVRRLEKKLGRQASETERLGERRWASMLSVFFSLVFSMLYTRTFFYPPRFPRQGEHDGRETHSIGIETASL